VPVTKSRVDLRKWNKLRADVAKFEGAKVNVGVLASKGGNAPHDGGKGITLIELAAVHEFGSPEANVPERSFLRRTFIEQAQPFGEVCAKVAKGIVLGRFAPPQALTIIGEWGVAAVRRTITEGDGVPPPNAESTKKAKGSSRPLVDTGQLLNAVAYDVVIVDRGHLAPPPDDRGHLK